MLVQKTHIDLLATLEEERQNRVTAEADLEAAEAKIEKLRDAMRQIAAPPLGAYATFYDLNRIIMDRQKLARDVLAATERAADHPQSDEDGMPP
jgi:hypothetical protein